MTRGKSRSRDTRLRRCISTNQSLPQSEMIRFVLSPQNVVLPDIHKKLPGRGVWVRSNRSDLEKVIEKRLFGKAFRSKVEVSDDLVQLVECKLLDCIIRLLALARRSGNAVGGLAKVKDEVKGEDIKVLFQASDGSARQIGKLSTPNRNTVRFECLNASEMGVAFSRETVIYACVRDSGIATRICAEAQRLSGFRS